MPVYTVRATRVERVSLDVEADSPEDAQRVLRNRGLWNESRVLPTSLGVWHRQWVGGARGASIPVPAWAASPGTPGDFVLELAERGRLRWGRASMRTDISKPWAERVAYARGTVWNAFTSEERLSLGFWCRAYDFRKDWWEPGSWVPGDRAFLHSHPGVPSGK